MDEGWRWTAGRRKSQAKRVKKVKDGRCGFEEERKVERRNGPRRVRRQQGTSCSRVSVVAMLGWRKVIQCVEGGGREGDRWGGWRTGDWEDKSG